MTERRKSIGSEGLEQGGPDLGNDYTRYLGSRDRSDALSTPDTIGLSKKDDDKDNNRNAISGDLDNDDSLEEETDAGEDDLDDDDDDIEDDEDEDEDDDDEKDMI